MGSGSWRGINGKSVRGRVQGGLSGEWKLGERSKVQRKEVRGHAGETETRR